MTAARWVGVTALVLFLGAVGAWFLIDDRSPTYEDVPAVFEAFEDQDLSCVDRRLLDAPNPSLRSFGLCFLDGDHEYEIDIYVFVDEEARERWLSSSNPIASVERVAGTNWVITTGVRRNSERIADAIGGEVYGPEEAP